MKDKVSILDIIIDIIKGKAPVLQSSIESSPLLIIHLIAIVSYPVDGSPP